MVNKITMMTPKPAAMMVEMMPAVVSSSISDSCEGSTSPLPSAVCFSMLVAAVLPAILENKFISHAYMILARVLTLYSIRNEGKYSTRRGCFSFERGVRHQR